MNSFVLLGGSLLACLSPLPHLHAQSPGPLRFDSLSTDAAIRFAYPDTARDAYLRQLRTEHKLAALTAAAPDHRGRALLLSQWVHSLWRHNGGNEPSQPDALTIIREARAGKNFRCVEYARVLTDAMLAVGLKARVLAVKTQDCATRKSGAGHVLTEVWLPEAGKWALLDAQFDLMPVLADRPLNAVELQAALAQGRPVRFVTAQGPVSSGRQKQYLRFLTPYLYFLDVEFDQRHVAARDKLTVNGKPTLLLTPAGVAAPATFQRRFPLDYTLPTSALRDFYRAPE